MKLVKWPIENGVPEPWIPVTQVEPAETWLICWAGAYALLSKSIVANAMEQLQQQGKVETPKNRWPPVRVHLAQAVQIARQIAAILMTDLPSE